jgi:hypothetical protein
MRRSAGLLAVAALSPVLLLGASTSAFADPARPAADPALTPVSIRMPTWSAAATSCCASAA